MATPLPPSSQGKGWRVTDQQEQTGVGPDGRASAGVLVFFQTARGISGTVFIPKATFTPENVQAAIAGYVQQLHAVSDLSG